MFIHYKRYYITVSFLGIPVPHPNARCIVVKCIHCTYISLSLNNATLGLYIILIHLKPLWPNTKLVHLLIAKLLTFIAAIRTVFFMDSASLVAFFRYANSNLKTKQNVASLKISYGFISTDSATKAEQLSVCFSSVYQVDNIILPLPPSCLSTINIRHIFSTANALKLLNKLDPALLVDLIGYRLF